MFDMLADMLLFRRLAVYAFSRRKMMPLAPASAMLPYDGSCRLRHAADTDITPLRHAYDISTSLPLA